ncbi:MAG: methyltransferase, partial [Planctomycetes bacterium]|nr:methyltransferase [Planctomycetota bacterium]
PLDLGGTFVTGIAAGALHRLRKHLGLEDRAVKGFDLLQMLGEVEMDLVERFNLDVLSVERPTVAFGIKNENWKPWELFDGTPVMVPGDFNVDVSPEGDWLLRPLNRADKPPIGRMPKNGFYFDSIGYNEWDPNFQPPPMKEMEEAAWKYWIMGEPLLQYFADRARLLRENTDKALVMWSGGAGVHYVGRLTEFLCLLATDKEYVADLFMLCAETSIRNLELLWQAVGENIDVFVISGLDFGTQRGEFFSVETFRETYLPAFKKQFEWIHEHTTWKIFEHSCGSVANLIGDLVGAGLDALNPVQTTAANMDPEWLAEQFGDRLTFWGGGVDTQTTLTFGTPEEVREEVKERIRLFAPGGGMVFNPVHNIQYNTPPENIVAAYETAREFGRYPITC